MVDVCRLLGRAVMNASCHMNELDITHWSLECLCAVRLCVGDYESGEKFHIFNLNSAFFLLY
jgi:hypothetical protein